MTFNPMPFGGENTMQTPESLEAQQQQLVTEAISRLGASESAQLRALLQSIQEHRYILLTSGEKAALKKAGMTLEEIKAIFPETISSPRAEIDETRTESEGPDFSGQSGQT